MKDREEYLRWLENPALDAASRAELEAIRDNEEEIRSRFGAMLSFGTAGLRGVMGAGTNRMNLYTVRQATAGLAEYLLSCGNGAETRGVAVAYDSRRMSPEFSRTVCRVLAAYGIRSYLFDELRPTPELSFAVRDLHAAAGVNITASHNPKQYNGYKVYGEDGAQIGPEQADAVSARIRATDLFGVRECSDAEAASWITVLNRDYDERYMAAVLSQVQDADVIRRMSGLRVVYTPFHGAGLRLVPEILKRAGFSNVYPVAEQMIPDGNFPTVESPNPENKEGFALGMKLADAVRADLLVGTDPDCDRMGVVVRLPEGGFTALTGNQVGVILLDYIIRTRKRLGRMPEDGCAVKTIVSTEMAARVCEKNGVTMYNVLTGFKFIGEKMEMFKREGGTFLLGFEESYGYLVGDYARDKDGAVAALLVCEAAAYYASRGMTLYDAMQALYREYGFHTETTSNFRVEGADASEKMKERMERLRKDPPKDVAGLRVVEVRDYLCGIDGLPPSDVLYDVLEDRSVVVVRPSGTEPKIKLYVMTAGETEEDSRMKNERIREAFRPLISQ